ncbi:MAG: hypothetical protein R3B47_12195 [Bacteroidia bacterium]
MLACARIGAVHRWCSAASPPTNLQSALMMPSRRPF